jgi:hypothetical protein
MGKLTTPGNKAKGKLQLALQVFRLLATQNGSGNFKQIWRIVDTSSPYQHDYRESRALTEFDLKALA